MWGPNEIVQGDSGLVVSNKLDAEFARIQNNEAIVDARLDGLVYTTPITILDKTEDSEIVSPYTMWGVLDPQIARITAIETWGQYLSQTSFDGTFWIRSSVMFEYTGTYVQYDDLDIGNLITKEHLEQRAPEFLESAIWRDGTYDMDAGYVPVNEQSVATKAYVDEGLDDINTRARPLYKEYATSQSGDSVFNASLAGVEFAVYKNGFLQRRSKYTYNNTSFTFNDVLDEGDEITLIILGAS